jgi:hypothetical protein
MTIDRFLGSIVLGLIAGWALTHAGINLYTAVTYITMGGPGLTPLGLKALKPQEYEVIEWVDPSSDWDGWQDIEKIANTRSVVCYSIGWPIREDEVFVYLAMDYSDGTCNTIGKIPHAAIKSRKKVKLRGFPPKEKKKETWTHQMVNDPEHPEGTKVVLP